MSLIKTNQIQDGHFHAWSLYEPISLKHFFYLFNSILACKITRSKSVTAHLPVELQHRKYSRTKMGVALIGLGNFLAALVRVNLYWENAPLLNFGVWDLKHGQTEWELVPHKISLCLDTGHLILGSGSIQDAQNKILAIFRDRQDQIKHLHIHENDLIHDSHLPPNKIITPEIIREITQNRTYVFEK